MWTYSFRLGRSGISSPEVSSSAVDCTRRHAKAGENQRHIKRLPVPVEVYTSAVVSTFPATPADTKSGETPECSADNEAIKLHLRPVLVPLSVSSSSSSFSHSLRKGASSCCSTDGTSLPFATDPSKKNSQSVKKWAMPPFSTNLGPASVLGRERPSCPGRWAAEVACFTVIKCQWLWKHLSNISHILLSLI